MTLIVVFRNRKLTILPLLLPVNGTVSRETRPYTYAVSLFHSKKTF